MQKIDNVFQDVIDEIAVRFRESINWDLVRRNRAIAARNRFLAEHGEWLGLDWPPMPLEGVTQ